MLSALQWEWGFHPRIILNLCSSYILCFVDERMQRGKKAGTLHLHPTALLVTRMENVHSHHQSWGLTAAFSHSLEREWHILSLTALSAKPLGCLPLSWAAWGGITRGNRQVGPLYPWVHTAHLYNQVHAPLLGTGAVSVDAVTGRCCVLQAEGSEETSPLNTHKKFPGTMTACLCFAVYIYTDTHST